MSLLQKVNISLPDTSDEDPRIGHLLDQTPDREKIPGAVIIGFPSDRGVKRNGGRSGASEGPSAIREQLYKMTPDAEDPASFSELVKSSGDAGNINIIGDVESDQQALGEVVASYLRENAVPIILGGGHETAFGHFLGYAKANLSTAILNMDAHTDVRPLKNGKAHSGSPFRQAMEHESNCCKQYLAAGLQPHSVAKSHIKYINDKGGRVVFREETNITKFSGLFDITGSERIMVTFDMDAVDQAFAPGVSAPCTNGLHPDLWLTAAYLAGRNKNVTSFDLSEVNPYYDRDDQTAKLAALTIWHFLLGISQR